MLRDSSGIRKLDHRPDVTGLGYPAGDAAAAVRTLPEDASGNLEDLIMQALRALARE